MTNTRRQIALDLPAVRDLPELIEVMQDRLRRIQEALSQGSGSSDLDMGGYRVRNMGRAIRNNDATTLAQVRSLINVALSTRALLDGDTSATGQSGSTTTALTFRSHRIAVSAATTASVPNADAGHYVLLWIEQDSTGGWPVSFPTTWDGFTGLEPATGADLVSLYPVLFFSPTTARLAGQPIRGLPKTNTP